MTETKRAELNKQLCLLIKQKIKDEGIFLMDFSTQMGWKKRYGWAKLSGHRPLLALELVRALQILEVKDMDFIKSIDFGDATGYTKNNN